MDYNQMPLGLGYAAAMDRLTADNFSNMSDDEKKNISKETEVIYLKKSWTG